MADSTAIYNVRDSVELDGSGSQYRPHEAHEVNVNIGPDAQSASSNAPFHSQLDAISPTPRQENPRVSTPHNSFSHPNTMKRLDMSAVANSLPNPARVTPQTYNQYSYNSPLGASNYASLNASYPPTQISSTSVQSMPSFVPLQYIQGIPQLTRTGLPTQMSSAYPTYGSCRSFPHSPVQHHAQNMTGYPMQFMPPYVPQEVYPQVPIIQYQEMHPRSYMPVQIINGDYVSPVQTTNGDYMSPTDAGHPTHYAIDESTPCYPRGPPRKPKQSGHALWVGNLPPGTTVIDLKDHFSRDATTTIESLFLISKSNCAFVNYKSEAACSSAMARFHDSRFNGVRLVCRLRRGSTPAATGAAPANGKVLESPTKGDGTFSNKSTERSDSQVVIASGSNVPVPVLVSSTPEYSNTSSKAATRIPEKYFIVKNLTLQDLDASVRNSIWVTQSHNEAALNEAFESADNVYLIFSANKSGEYFGYARMSSQIRDEAVGMTSHHFVHRQPQDSEQPENATDGPKSIVTPATEWAPRGRVMDDSARGTIFWEASGSDTDDYGDDNDNVRKRRDGGKEQDKADGEVDKRSVSSIQIEEQQKQRRGAGLGGQDSGKPFRIEWMSTNRLPFYRTRGLRNPWNANREVKIARDGTELEPGVGKRLVQMFHHRPPFLTSPAAVAMGPASAAAAATFLRSGPAMMDTGMHHPQGMMPLMQTQYQQY